MAQNRSNAVMATRVEPADSLDDFPTPPWATRAFLTHHSLPGDTVWEPACGRGYMARVLQEFFPTVYASDVHDYGYASVQDFLKSAGQVDWIITNPPFRLAQEFLEHARTVAKIGCAFLTRTVFIEGTKRYNSIYRDMRPNTVLQYAERVPMVKGRVDRSASTATSYAWSVWRFDQPATHTELDWIPPSRRDYEKDSDYV